MAGEIEAVSAVALRPYCTPADIWRDDVIHVDGVHSEAFREVERAFAVLRERRDAPNVVLQGRPGIGKSHFLGKLRRDILRRGEIFVLVELSDARQFWQSVSISLAGSLFRERPDGESQLAAFIRDLGGSLDLAEEQIARLAAGAFSKRDFEGLVKAADVLLRVRVQGRFALDALIALVLVNSRDFAERDIGASIYMGLDLPHEDRRNYSLSPAGISPREFVKGFDAILSIAGKSALIAVDQLDGLVALSKAATEEEEASILDQVANGLMDLAMDTGHALVVVSCLPVTWERVAHEAIASAADRYPIDLKLNLLPSPDVAQALAAAYLASGYRRVGFAPPYPTWPIRPRAFDAAKELSPREVLKEIDQHLRRCRAAGRVTELDALVATQRDDETPPEPGDGFVPLQNLADLDQRFQGFLNSANIAGVLDESNVDGALPELLQAGLQCWVEENSEHGGFSVDPLPGRKPALHGRLRQTLDSSVEDEVHWSFRAIPHQNARAALTRLREAIVAAGLGAKRKLLIVRNSDWSPGQATQETLAEFLTKGGEVVRMEDGDLRIFDALARLRREEPENLRDWLAARKPASGARLLQHFRSPSPAPPSPEPVPDIASGSSKAADASPPPDLPGAIVFGHSLTDGGPVHVGLKTLCRHIAIFAGSGSGKTVLIRRIVEECALAGVSSIVLDPNNDLARLGVPWPEAPKDWRAEDAAKAGDYHANTDVVVWTPRINAGRPLSFAPLADLNAVVSDPDEFEIALDNAVAALIARAGLPNGARRDLGRAVLKESLRAFFSNSSGGLHEFLAFLRELPDGVSVLDGAGDLAWRMAQALQAATINDPLFGGQGAPVDPGMLLQPDAGKRARISVINFSGLPNDDQRQSFVAQLQMALFAWVKKNPAGERPLGGLLVMDEAQIFAPSSGSSLCLQSTLALASQARKYGLGLIFATQAPKGLNNRIPGNATTQFFGFLNVPVQIEAAKEMAAAKGGAVTGIAQLHSGEFFVASDGLAFQKIKSPLCLSWHPRAPLTQEEIIALARRSPNS